MIDTRLDARLLKTRDAYIAKLKEMGIRTFRDLLLYFPRTYRDEQEFTKINEMRTDQVNVVQGTLKSILNVATRGGKVMTRAVVADESGEIPVLWFNQAHIKQMFFKGSSIILTGKLKYERGRSMLMSPKYEKPRSQLLHTGRIVPVYSEKDEVTSKWLREKIFPLLSYAQYFEDYLPEWLIQEQALMRLPEAIYHVHFAKDEEHLAKARERLAFDELFFLQFLALKRKALWQESFQREGTVGLPLSPANLEAFLDALPFKLTGAQYRVIAEILEDFGKAYPMLRLVQGDVGAGKTVVAAAVIYAMKQAACQSVVMAPTEILARQHYKTLLKFLAPFHFNVQILTGSSSMSEYETVLRQLSTGTCDVVVGTHALIQEGIQFSNLGLAVIDEQHRFGVKQRAVFKMHGQPHILNLSATPIPRTLALTLYGDQELSTLDELPPGRQEIVTRLVPENKRGDAYLWISDQIAKGRQVFIICPLIEESEAIQVKAATLEYERLSKEIFPQYHLALLHGRMKAEEKDAIMKDFASGSVDILVSTSVVEVGIDVPNASIMMIEGADRFGLAQLHQFRGRVGRGVHQSYCFLFSDSNSDAALQRLNYMVKYNSGFDLAELDLQMRGPGEIYGVKQSGIPDLKVANFSDARFLSRVRECAQKLVTEDVHLQHYSQLAEKVRELELKADLGDGA